MRIKSHLQQQGNASFHRKSGKTCVCVFVCVLLLTYHLCASISGHGGGGRHRTHLRGNVLQAAVGRPGSAQLSIQTRVSHHPEWVGVGAGHRQRRAEAGGCNQNGVRDHIWDSSNLQMDGGGGLQDSPRVSTPGGLLAADLRAEVVLGGGASAWDVGELDLDTGVVDFSL